jgi:hypothetical protein
LVIPFKITLPSTNRIVCDIEDVKARKVYEAYKEFFKKWLLEIHKELGSLKC